MDLDVERLSDEELRDAITTWGGRVAAGEARLLHLIGELDVREAWGMHGVLSCADWVAWKLGVSHATAQERVRVARALRELPLVAGVFGQGRLSYAQVRALTRVATAQDEQRWVELAGRCTAEQLEKAQRGAARVRRNEQRRTEPDTVAWQDRVRVRWDDDGTLVLTVRVSPEHAPAVLAVLEQEQAAEQAERDARWADLAVELAGGASAEGCGEVLSAESDQPAETGEGCGEALSAEGTVPERYVFEEPPYPVLSEVGFGQPTPEADRVALAAYWDELHRRRAKAAAWQEHEERLQAEAAVRELPTGKATLGDALVRALTRPSTKRVSVQLLVDPLSGWARTATDELLPPSTLRRLLAAPPTVADVGRRGHDVPVALRALLGQVDGQRCRFPGCGRTKKLHAHHVLWWSRGGRTDLANLVLVCARHHTLIHRDGYQLVLRPDRVLVVRTADGTLLSPHVARPAAHADDLDPQQAVTAETLPTQWGGERMDLGYVVNVMLQHAA